MANPSPLASVTQLAARLPFDMDEGERREAAGALADLSDEARYYGSDNWLTPTEAPYSVINMVLKAAVRHMKNPDGFIQSRAGDESVAWVGRGEESGGASFTSMERERLRELGGDRRPRLHSVGVYGWQTKETPATSATGRVPVDGTSYTYPLYASEGPWP